MAFHRDFAFEDFQNILRLCIPHTLMAFLILLSFAPLSFAGVDLSSSSFVLMALYYWAIYRPTLYAPASVFGIGLLIDFISGMPPGLNALLFVLIQWLIREQRRFLMGQTFVVKWIIFGLVLTGFEGFLWGLAGLPHFEWSMDLLQKTSIVALFSWLLFPLVIRLLIITHHFLPEQRRV
jgi:rod shape-determining protein MreD